MLIKLPTLEYVEESFFSHRYVSKDVNFMAVTSHPPQVPIPSNFIVSSMST